MRFDLLADLESRVQPLLRHINENVPKGTGFALLLFRFDGPEATYGANAERSDMIKFLRECADRLEDRQDKPPIRPTSN
jgi:hypothetical protein